MTRAHWLRLIKCECLLLLVLYDCKPNICTHIHLYFVKCWWASLLSIWQNSIFKCRKPEDVTIMQSSFIATQISFMVRCFLCYCLALHADAQVLRWNASVMRDVRTVPNTEHFLKTKYNAEHMRKRVADREGELQMNSSVILPHPAQTQTRKLGLADSVNSDWPPHDAAGCQLLTTWRVNNHTYTLPPHLSSTFSDLIWRPFFRCFRLYSEPEALLGNIKDSSEGINNPVSVNKARWYLINDFFFGLFKCIRFITCSCSLSQDLHVYQRDSNELIWHGWDSESPLLWTCRITERSCMLTCGKANKLLCTRIKRLMLPFKHNICTQVRCHRVHCCCYTNTLCSLPTCSACR